MCCDILSLSLSLLLQANCQPWSKIGPFLCTYYVTHKLCFKCMGWIPSLIGHLASMDVKQHERMGWMCLCAHEATVFSPQMSIKFLMPIPNMDYKQKCCALKLLPLEKQLLLNNCVLMQKVVHSKTLQYLKHLMIPFECLYIHGNKQLLPKTRTDIFKKSFFFWGSLVWNSLPHHLRYPMELKTFKRKAC